MKELLPPISNKVSNKRIAGITVSMGTSLSIDDENIKTIFQVALNATLRLSWPVVALKPLNWLFNLRISCIKI